MSLLMMCTGCKSSSDTPVIHVSSSSAESSAYSSTETSSGSSSAASAVSSGGSSVGGSSSGSSSNVSSAESSAAVSSSSSQSVSVPTYSSAPAVSSSAASSAAVSSSSSSSSSSVQSSSSSSSSSVSSPVSSEPPAPVTPELPDDPIQRKIAQMSLREKVYQLFFVTPEQLGGSYPVTSPIDISEKPVGGILLMGANLTSVSQTQHMLSKTQEYALQNGIGVFLAVDEEGGKVARCAKNLGTAALDPMAVYGARNDSDEAYGIGRTLGNTLKSLGFNVDFAPVADVDISPTNELGDRIFSDDPAVAANMVENVVRGMNSTGVSATLKHFPGLGAEDGNTHTDSSIIIDRTLEQLRSTEFVPFKSGISAGADFVMVGHQKVSSFGDDLPADLSYTAVTTMLRGELGFTGIAITDAQNMNTISNVYYSRTAAKLAIQAGIDMILAPEDLDDAVNGVLNAVQSGEISEERINRSVERILTLKMRMGLL